jgi:uncharacterized membrane protein YeiH
LALFAFDLLALFLYGLTGAMAAAKRGYDIVGVFALALVTAAGGGLIRDGLFLQQGPPVLVRDSWSLLAVLAAAILGPWLIHRWDPIGRMYAVFDAVGLAVYAVVGVERALGAELAVPSAILVGVVNATGGGILRDLLTRQEPLIFRPGQFYALAAVAGAAVYAVLRSTEILPDAIAALCGGGLALLLRLLAIGFNWKTRALGVPPSNEPTAPSIQD